MAIDVLLVSLATTAGLRAADDELAGALRRAGASTAVARTRPPRALRTMALSDLALSVAARRTARAALALYAPRAIVYCTTTSALLWPRPGAVRFDATAQGNRPGRHGLWQRPVERRRLDGASLLVPCSSGALEEGRRPAAPALVVPVPVDPSGPPSRERDVAAITYAANPHKKGLDRVLAAWQRARAPGEELVVCGAESSGRLPGVRWSGLLGRSAYRALLRRARVYVTAPRREDYGLAQLEALADGCLLVTNPAPGPYAALPIARALDPRLVSDELAGALRAALDDPVRDYAERARVALAPFRRGAVDALVAEQLLPRLLAR